MDGKNSAQETTTPDANLDKCVATLAKAFQQHQVATIVVQLREQQPSLIAFV